MATLGLVLGAIPAMAEVTPVTDKKLPPVLPDKGPPLPQEAVKAFVAVAHRDLAQVEAMLKEQPHLINAVWDWGGGDFETALGAAAHMGRPDIARFLIAHGARMDLYAAAMLGELEIVRSVLTAFPDVRHTPGAHGIPLMAHAKAGGEKAESVVRYLESLA